VFLLPWVQGCGPEEEGPDAVILGARIWWGDREHHDADEYLRTCGEFLGLSNFEGMSVFFDGDARFLEFNCGQHSIAGCMLRDRMAAVVLDQPSVWNTALCHEAVHAFVAPTDYDHTGPIWAELNAAGLNGSPREKALGYGE